MSSFSARLKSLIEAQGPLSIAQFMALALMDPSHGYYATRDPFGATGDFITAPEISQMFGELVGLWLVQAWHDQGSPRARLVEFGPGRGTLMADALRAAKKTAPDFLSAVEVTLVEASAKLRALQERTLVDSSARLQWQPSFADSEDGPLFVVANEFFDALPIRQFVFDGEGWRERMVGLDERGDLAFALAPTHAKALAAPPARGQPKPGDVYEVCPSGLALAEHLAQSIATRGGAALLIDYGYGDDVGFGDTLQAVRAHAYADILATPGEADLTTHVDFVALATAARRGGACACGPVCQGDLLDRLGLAARVDALSKANPTLATQFASEAERLRALRQMGQLFKALAIMPKDTPVPAGF